MMFATWYRLLIAVTGLGLVAGCVPVWMVPKTNQPTAPPPAASAPATPAQPPATAQPEAPAAEAPAGTEVKEPGEKAALQTAKTRHPAWEAMVNSHTGDWAEVVLKLGPAWGKWTNLMRLRWTGEAYQVVAEGPIPEERPAPAAKKQPASGGGEKSPAAARRLVLRRHPGWVAKVVSVEDDGQVVVVWVGPPESEFVWWYRVAWSGGRYVIQDHGAIQGPDSM